MHISAYNTEDEEAVAMKKRPFQFLNLPSELRDKVYDYIFGAAPEVLDLDPDNFRLVHRHIESIFKVSKQVHDEASHRFYSKHAIRVFPCHPGRFFKTKKPLLARLSPRYRQSLSCLELRLGPGFAAPPRGWVINDALGLEDCKNVRVVKVMVQIDPSNPIFKGFRRGNNNFYESFSRELLQGVLMSVPAVREVQFDAYPGVSRHGVMMTGLIEVTRNHKPREADLKTLVISYGPERNWKIEVDQELKDEMTDCVLAGSMSTLSIGSPPVSTQNVLSVFG